MVNRSGIRVFAIAEGCGTAPEWAAALAGFQPSVAPLLKSDKGAAVWRATQLGRDVVIKRWEHRTLWSKLKLFLGFSRGRRHWRGAMKLLALGVRSARPLVLAREFGEGVSCEWLVLEFVPGRTLIDVLDRSGMGVSAEHALARVVGGQIGVVANAGLYNRDHKPSNLIVAFDPAGAPAVTVIDTVAVRRCAPGSLRRAAQMLASLHIEPAGLGCPARVTVRARCVREVARALLGRDGASPPRAAVRAAGRLLWETAAHIVTRHGDPRPRVDPRADRA